MTKICGPLKVSDAWQMYLFWTIASKCVCVYVCLSITHPSQWTPFRKRVDLYSSRMQKLNVIYARAIFFARDKRQSVHRNCGISKSIVFLPRKKLELHKFEAKNPKRLHSYSQNVSCTDMHDFVFDSTVVECDARFSLGAFYRAACVLVSLFIRENFHFVLYMGGIHRRFHQFRMLLSYFILICVFLALSLLFSRIHFMMSDDWWAPSINNDGIITKIINSNLYYYS